MKQKLNDLIATAKELDRGCPSIDNVIPFACYGDYDNSCHVERANYRWLFEKFENVEGVIFYYGAYGSHWAVVDPSKASEETIEILIDYLENIIAYPCIDDDLASEVEDELFESHLRIVKFEDIPYLKELILSHDNLLDKLVYTLRPNFSDIGYVEGGGTVAIDWEKANEYLMEDKVFQELKWIYETSGNDMLEEWIKLAL